MSQTTSIEWCDVSWGPVHGCSIVSTECRNCYAATLSLRYGHTSKPWTPANAADNVMLKPHKLREPLSNAKMWRGLGAAAAAAGKTDGKLVFVNSMSDLWHEQVPDDYIRAVFGVMEVASRHTFQILTKRPERMRDWCNRYQPEPLPNVWLGTSIGLRHFVHRADLLRQTPAAVRFISAEPLLGPLAPERMFCSTCSMEGPDDRCDECEGIGDWWLDGGLRLDEIDWLIVGGESGSGHRRFNADWARDLRDLAADYETAFFMKQTGGARPGTRLEDLPEDLRIREFPRSTRTPERVG